MGCLKMENEKRLIDANELSLKIIATKFNLGSAQSNWQKGYIDGLMAAFCLIKDAPTVDALEVVHARWEAAGFDGHGDYKECCSNCATWSVGDDKLYCPCCGAKMDGGNEDG